MEITDSSHPAHGTPIPITQVQLSFVLSRIPEATFSLPVGYNPLNRKKSPAHKIVREDLENVPIKVKCRGKGKIRVTNRGRVEHWPNSDVLIWEGKITGLSHLRNRGQYQFTVSSSHWLSDLESGTMASDSFARGSAAKLTSELLGSDSNALLSSNFLNILAGENQSSDSKTDLWESVLLPGFRVLMGEEDVSDSGFNISKTAAYYSVTNALGNEDKTKSVSEEAQEKLTGNIHLSNLDGLKVIKDRFNQEKKINPGTLPLPYGNNTDSQQFYEHLGKLLKRNWGTTTALGRLLSVAQSLQLQLTSNVESASLIPYIPVFPEKNVWRTLKPSDYISVEGRGARPYRLSSVVLIGTDELDTGAVGSNSNYAGAYIGRAEGRVKLMRSPPWLYTSVLPDYPAEEAKNDKKPDEPSETSENKNNKISVGSAFAHAYWLNEVFKDRTARITCPLRFDICPGSALKLDGLSLSDELVDTDNSQSLFASVAGVRIILDANRPAATTELSLTHVRTPGETSGIPDTHPMFTSPWYGSPLAIMRQSDLNQES